MSPRFLKHSQRTIRTAEAAPRSLFALILTVLPLALGCWLVATVLLSHLPHLTRDYSVPVRAQVVESRLEAGSGLPFFGTEHSFAYRYIYQGQLFRASSYRPGGYLDEAIRSHPVGSMLTVYLDPEAPRLSMVWPGIARDQIVDLGIGLVLILIGVNSFYWSAHRLAAGVTQ
jgi:hypothetical protein